MGLVRLNGASSVPAEGFAQVDTGGNPLFSGVDRWEGCARIAAHYADT